jgi:hypothetical protein
VAWWAEFSAGELKRRTEKLIINLPADSEARASDQGFAVCRKNISSLTNLDVGLFLIESERLLLSGR